MLSFKQYLEEQLLNEYSTAVPVPSGNASTAAWNQWNWNRRNQSAMDGSVITPTPVGFVPKSTSRNPAATPNTGLAGMDTLPADKRNKGGLEGEAGNIYARGHAQGGEKANTPFSRDLETGLGGLKYVMPATETAKAALGRGMGFNETDALNRINLYSGAANTLAASLGGENSLLSNALKAGGKEGAIMAGAALYDPRVAGMNPESETPSWWQFGDKEGKQLKTPQLMTPPQT